MTDLNGEDGQVTEREGKGWCMTDPTPPPDALEPPTKWRTLSDELAELERTNPEVRRAAENYDRTVRRILRRGDRG
jgi:hypothetical protein